MQVVVDSLLTQYEALGRGRVVVMLHGWGDRAAGLAGLQQALARKYRVIAVDLPGFGATQPPITTWGIEDYAQFVAHFLQKIGLHEIYAIVGHSNGGAVAIRGLSRGILQAEKLVLLAAAGIRSTEGMRKFGFKVLAKSGKAATVWLPAAQRQKMRQKLYKAAGSDMLIVPELQETFKKTVSQDVQDDAAKLTLPVLLLYGEKDTETPAIYGRQYHELMADSTLEVLADAGHFIHLDQPEKVKNAVEGFLE
ncbi:MAG TPA: alpha/beta hydrolase [Candidatus Saccharimonadales bacterium]|nr:alpha/beta hydrolase [Candidatus Saccharimonadales bacterium]